MRKLQIITFFAISFTIVSCKKEVDCRKIGKFKFEITNDSLFSNNSYLSPDSYGYVIGNLYFKDCGIKVLNTEKLNKEDDYIISMKPIESILDDSKRIDGEGQEHLSKEPLDIILKDTVTTDSLYIYILKPKGKYRLLLP